MLQDRKYTLEVVIGGPGTGKTTLTRSLIAGYGDRVIGLSPTGKGAYVLSQSIENPSYTIAMASVKKKLINDDTQAIVIDEAGMLCIEQFHSVLMLIRKNESIDRVIVTGDSGQLPPIGPGIVLDHISAFFGGKVLTVNHRSKDAIIGEDCQRVKNKQAPFRMIHAGVREAINQYDNLTRLYGEGNVKIICPTNDDINFFNAAIQRKFNPVVCTKNSYENMVFNGTQGSKFDNKIEWENNVITGIYEIDWKPAHAITCHRAQGGQWSAIVVYINSTRMITSEWLNTAISRAQEYHIVVCESPTALESALQRSRPIDRSRKTLLLEFLQGTAGYTKGE